MSAEAEAETKAERQDESARAIRIGSQRLFARELIPSEIAPPQTHLEANYIMYIGKKLFLATTLLDSDNDVLYSFKSPLEDEEFLKSIRSVFLNQCTDTRFCLGPRQNQFIRVFISTRETHLTPLYHFPSSKFTLDEFIRALVEFDENYDDVNMCYTHPDLKMINDGRFDVLFMFPSDALPDETMDSIDLLKKAVGRVRGLRYTVSVPIGHPGGKHSNRLWGHFIYVSGHQQRSLPAINQRCQDLLNKRMDQLLSLDSGYDKFFPSIQDDEKRRKILQMFNTSVTHSYSDCTATTSTGASFINIPTLVKTLESLELKDSV
jgi:hypothetical protein